MNNPSILILIFIDKNDLGHRCIELIIVSGNGEQRCTVSTETRESAFKRMWVGRHGNAKILKYPNWQPNHLLSLVRLS